MSKILQNIANHVEFSKEGIEQVGDSAIKIADNEGLDGHSRSIEYRLTKK